MARDSKMSKVLGGRHVLITGGSSGIGLALARLAVQDGAAVTLLARTLSRLEDAKQELMSKVGVHGGG